MEASHVAGESDDPTPEGHSCFSSFTERKNPIATEQSEVGRINERSDAAPTIANGMHIDSLPELRFAWSGLRCLLWPAFLLRRLIQVVSVDAAHSRLGWDEAYEQAKEMKTRLS